VITRERVIPLILEACPSFREAWQKSPEQSLYLAVGDFARHLLQLQQRDQTEEFPAVGQLIERLHNEGDHYVREAATLALFEGIQDVWGKNHVDPELFLPYLLPESARRWRSLKDFWDGKGR
jgi:hypothetical protein